MSNKSQVTFIYTAPNLYNLYDTLSVKTFDSDEEKLTQKTSLTGNNRKSFSSRDEFS